jgi:hypothetical protein
MAADPDFDKVVLLLHADGTNGSTTFTDSSATPKTAIAYNGAIISTAESKFGGSSLYFSGPTSHLRASPESAFTIGTDDFTMECWANYSSYSGARPLGLFNGTTGIVQMYISSGALGIETRDAYGGAGGSVPLNEWVHLAVTRESGVVRSFINGTKVYEYTDSGSLGTPAQVNINQYGNGGGSGGTGYIDDVRITIGLARYVANFTPPTEAFGGGDAIALSGNVKDASGANAARKVRAYREDTGIFVGEATSDGTTGNYSITTLYSGAHTLVFYPGTGEDLPALVLRGVVPV